MLTARRAEILKSIVEQYITRAKPVSSQSVIADRNLEISSATIRNEMVDLEQDGYIVRPHSSAGGIPLDKGYRFYVQAIGDVDLPLAEKLRVSHLFHQVEKELDQWLNLAAALIADMVRNAAIVTTPRPGACQFKHLELISLQESTVLLILVLNGARVREQLIVFDRAMSQPELSAIAARLSASFSGLTASQIAARATGQSGIERQVTDCLSGLMDIEDNREYVEAFLNGLHFTLEQPEFARNHKSALVLMELAEQRKLVKSIIPSDQGGKVHVVIGRENRSREMQDYSVVHAEYGLPKEATGTISVIGPTRMPYARTIATVTYLSTVLSWLVARLYGRSVPVEPDTAD